jgi:hypothetical protein
MNSHIPLAGRKALYARLVYLEANRSQAVAIIEAGAEPSLNLLTETVFTLTEQEMLTSNNAVPLDSFVQQFSLSLNTQAQTMLNHHLPLLHPILETVNERSDGICCRTCSGQDDVCKGDDQDDLLVSQPGHCILPLYNMFEEARASAIDYYSRYGTLVQSNSLPEITFSTAFCDEKPHDDPIACNVTGETTYPTNNGHNVSQVEINLCIKNLNWETYMAVPYVLFHEAICHTFQDIVPRQPRRLGSEPKDRFAEGWMDFVACEIMKRVLSNGSRINGTDLRFRSEQINIGTQFHHVRTNHDLDNRSVYAVSRAFGKEVADKILYLLERLPQEDFPASHPNAWDVFLRLSFDLNMLHMKYYDRMRLLALLHKNLPGRGQPDTLTRLEHLPQIMRKYLKTNNINSLIHDVSVLS